MTSYRIWATHPAVISLQLSLAISLKYEIYAFLFKLLTGRFFLRIKFEI